ncbi:hypothetical protein [Lacrimispora brassicae]
MNHDIYLDLITGDDIPFKDIKIHQPTLREIKEIGVNTYNQIMMPYTLTTDCFKGSEGNDPLNLLEDVLIKNKEFASCLVYSLAILANPKDILLHDKYLELVFEETTGKHSFIIDKNNFDELADIVLKINANKKVEVEKTPENMSDRQKDIWEKMQEGRKRHNKKNELHLFDIINICEFAGKYHIQISEIMNWTLWRIMNCYKAILSMKSYDDNLKICLVSGDGKSISGDNHWYPQLMIRE